MCEIKMSAYQLNYTNMILKMSRTLPVARAGERWRVKVETGFNDPDGGGSTWTGEGGCESAVEKKVMSRRREVQQQSVNDYKSTSNQERHIQSSVEVGRQIEEESGEIEYDKSRGKQFRAMISITSQRASRGSSGEKNPLRRLNISQ